MYECNIFNPSGSPALRVSYYETLHPFRTSKTSTPIPNTTPIPTPFSSQPPLPRVSYCNVRLLAATRILSDPVCLLVSSQPFDSDDLRFKPGSVHWI